VEFEEAEQGAIFFLMEISQVICMAYIYVCTHTYIYIYECTHIYVYGGIYMFVYLNIVGGRRFRCGV